MSLAPLKFDPKPASGSDYFFFDWSDWVRTTPNDEIDATQVTVTATSASGAALTISETVANGSMVRCRIAGGTANTTYTVTCRVTTTISLRTDSVDASLLVTR